MIALAPSMPEQPIRLPGALLEAPAPLATGASEGFDTLDESVEVGTDPIAYSKLTTGHELIYQLTLPAGRYALRVQLGDALTPFEPRLALYTGPGRPPAPIAPSIEDEDAVVELDVSGDSIELRLVAESGRVEVRALELVRRPRH